MRREKIIKRPDGSRVRITVRLTCDYTRGNTSWEFMCHSCQPGKRTWKTLVNHDDYGWRKLSCDDRKKEDDRRNLSLATVEEVREVMRELLASIELGI